jgi:DNA repair exonuclease SbcCD ATPase subunit
MYIKNLQLTKYKFFSFSRIKELIWEDINPISIIIGRNGSGKSSLISALLPQSLPRSSFLPNGYYKCTIEHNKTTYEIISDYSNKDKPHQFLDNGVNLNISGTTKVQQELFETKLGLTPDICKLLTMQHRITNMKNSYRRQYLSDINPNNIGLALEKYKKVLSKIKDINSIIKMLYLRKHDLTEQLLTDTVFEEINYNKEQLSNKLETLTSWHYALNNHINNLNDNRVDITDIPISNIRNKVNELRKPILSFIDIDKTNADGEITRLETTISKLEQNYQNSVDRVMEINKELEKYENYKNTASNNSELKNILEEKINDTLKCIESFSNLSSESTYLHIDEIEPAKSNINQIKNILSELVNTDTLLSEKVLNKIREKINKYKLSIDYISSDIEKDEIELDKISESYKPTIPCNDNYKSDCTLFREYKAHTDTVTEHRDKLTANIKANKRKIQTYNKAIDNLEVFYSENSYYRQKYDELYTLCVYKVSGLSYILKRYTVDDLLKKGIHVGAHLEKYIHDSERYHEKISHEKTLSLLKDKLFDITNNNTIPSDLLEQLIDDNRAKKHGLLDNIGVIEKQLANNTKKLKIYKSYKDAVNLVSKYKTTLDKYIYSKKLHYSIEYYEKVRKTIADLMSQTNVKLTELSNIIKEQEQIRYTLEKEINTNIVKYEALLKDYQYIEMALSPTSGFPHKLTIDFLNKIIQNTNVFIDKVFSYPFQLMELDINDKFDYSFKVKVGTTTISDISYCSKGQRTMIDLAFNLSTIIQLEMTDYPIFLDEIDKEFDDFHKQELISLFRYITSYEIVKQLFMVSHSQIMIGLESDFLTLGYDNEVSTNDNKQNITITKY